MVFSSVPSLSFSNFCFRRSQTRLSHSQAFSLSRSQTLPICRNPYSFPQNPRNWKKQRTCMLLAPPPTLDSNELYPKKHLKNSKAIISLYRNTKKSGIRINLPVNMWPVTCPGQALNAPDDLPKNVTRTLNQGSIPMTMDFHPSQQTLLLGWYQCGGHRVVGSWI
ncbi:protein TOPLESS-like [Pyrus communis]|uniref:protein TOPLESS-like n=1 Tax=Pyrus communis TaxID=23211 RepID=UPI0035BFD291